MAPVLAAKYRTQDNSPSSALGGPGAAPKATPMKDCKAVAARTS